MPHPCVHASVCTEPSHVKCKCPARSQSPNFLMPLVCVPSMVSPLSQTKEKRQQNPKMHAVCFGAQNGKTIVQVKKKQKKIMPVPTSRSQKRLHRQVRVPMIKNGRSEKKLFTQPGNVSREEAKVNRRKKKTRTRSRKRDQTKKRLEKKVPSAQPHPRG